MKSSRRSLPILTTCAALVALAALRVAPAAGTTGGAWVSQGPALIRNGGSPENIPNGEDVGAIDAVAAHPSNADVLYVGSVNGGVWRTTNATAASPSWTPLTDDKSSLSVGSLVFDPTDGTNQTLVAGIGRFSSIFSTGGARTGILRTTDGGSNWTDINGGLAGKNIWGVSPRGSTIVVAASDADSGLCSDIGIFRSTNTGASFAQVAPAGTALDLASDPSSTSTLFTALVFANVCTAGASSNGIYKSTNTGASWSKVSNATMDALLVNGTTRNVKIAVGPSNHVYVGIENTVGSKRQLVGLFHSSNGGTSWTSLDLPGTTETTGFWGINPGGQGEIHFSIAVDPSNGNIVYVGGDRQPAANEGMSGAPTFPNSIGANRFAGRLFRGDVTQPSGSQWVHLTHSSSLGPAGGGTASSSAPHADSRRLVFDASGRLIEADDGGVYRRTSPQNNTGDWASLNGNLRITELHDVAYDTVSNIVFGGAQDNGTVQPPTSGASVWVEAFGGDGGDVAVDTTTISGQSIRYLSAQSLQGLRRRAYDSANVLQSDTPLALTVVGGGAALAPQFRTPIELDKVAPTRLVIVGDNSIYESLDQGGTITEIGPGQGPNAGGISLQNAVAYGGKTGGVPNPDVLYVGVNSQVLIRTTSGGALTASGTYPGGSVRDVVLDVNDWTHAFVADSSHVYQTTNTGGSWTNVTGNLTALGAKEFRTLAFVASTPTDKLVLGTNAGVFVATSNDFAVWDQLGTGLPNALVFDLFYDPPDDVLAAGMLGRGAWTLANVSGVTVTTTTTTTIAGTTTTTTLPEDTGSTPPNKNVAKCESTVMTNLAKLKSCLVKCHIKAADSALALKTFDEEACEQGVGTPLSCFGKYFKTDAALESKGICPPCLDQPTRAGFAVQLESDVDTGNAGMYCAGTAPFGGEDSGFLPPDKNTAKCEDSVAKNVVKLDGCIRKCHVKRAATALAGKPFDEEACESSDPINSCRAKYNKTVAKLVGLGTCPSCLGAGNQGMLADQVETSLDAGNGQVYCTP